MPESRQVTSRPLSRATLKVALGRTSFTVPSSLTTFFFDKGEIIGLRAVGFQLPSGL